MENLGTISLIVGIGGGLLVIVGTLAGWFGKLSRWVRGWIVDRLAPDRSPYVQVPNKSLIVQLVPGMDVPSWSMVYNEKHGSFMHLAFTVLITNITKSDVTVASIKIQPNGASGAPQYTDLSNRSKIIEPGHAREAEVRIAVRPPIADAGSSFVCDVNVIDQYSNGHVLKNVEFPSNDRSNS